jgi:pimeloyl-ACP methyl ester carboxylesterase
LFIIGTDDVAAPMADVLQQVYLPEVSYIHILENTGHMGMLERTEQLNQHVKAFIAAI